MVNVLLIVTGSVATIKTWTLTEAIQKALRAAAHTDVGVRVVATASAQHFLASEAIEAAPSAFQPVPLITDSHEWDKWKKRGDSVEHIELRKWADIAVVAPLSANSLAKLANGLADNLAMSVLRAWEWTSKPVIIAPSMNTAMWEHPLTAPQLATVRGFNRDLVHILPPVSKMLVCGDTGVGAMASLEDIVAAVVKLAAAPSASAAATAPTAASTITAAGAASEHKTRELICELCRQFYTLGWVSGTGGGISIKDTVTGRVLVAPSGVQKERIQPDDLFVLDPQDQNNILENPRCASASKLKQSECTPLFYNTYQLANAAACMHSHSRSVVLLSMMLPADAKEFKITRIEMIKGIKKATTKIAHRFDETLVVPIIENTNFERDLTASMRQAMIDYPDAYCVIVRRHGAYVWGDTWESAKTQAECYDYLFAIAIDMLSKNIELC